MVGYDTAHFKQGTFSSESEDWVFDVMVEMADAADDWLGAGVKVTALNGATFRIVGGGGNPPIPGSGTPNRYRCFFSVPGDVADPDHYDTPLTSGSVTGAYNPLDDVRIYSTTEINANWYDTGASDDGPAAIIGL